MRNSQKRDFSVRKSSPLFGAQTNSRPLLQRKRFAQAVLPWLRLLSSGKVFHYHGFYPWFILGEMSVDPEEFIDVA